MLYNGGYTMINIQSENVYNEALNCLSFKGQKAIMLCNNDNVEIASKIKLDGENIIISCGSEKFIINKNGVTSTNGITDITKLTDGQCDALECGDILVKNTGNEKHSYRVSYKQDKHGLCLTYSDASVVETVSYDYTEGHWVYNSTDSTPISA